jgi:acyl-coenzyme A synthetase/AMP-(fatty) acid ligase
VLGHHAGVSNLAAAQSITWTLGESSRVLQFASLSFDASLFEITLALAHGAALCIGAPDQRVPGPEMMDFLIANRISIAVLPPSLLAGLQKDRLPQLENLIVAGESCPARVAEEWGTGRKLWNAYGPTEASVWTTIFECPGSEPPDAPPIGAPIANVRCYVLDDHLTPLPVGIPGELCISGAGLAHGYLDRPELTAARFVPDPFSVAPGTRLFRTGDRVCWLPDGNLQFLGRMDLMVKIRGLRIELEEIEAALRELSGIGDAAVTVNGEGPDSFLAAYAIPQEGLTLSEPDLKNNLTRKLPSHMVPATVTFLDSFPRTPAGKLDRQALRLASRPPAAPARYVAPRNETERALAELWTSLLQQHAVGIHENFFNLGGHSLSATRLVSAVRRMTQIELPLRTFFEKPTIAEQAQIIDEMKKNGSASASGAIAALPRVAQRIDTE